MALVAYSDSEGSDTESNTAPAPSQTTKPDSRGFAVDRSNPRKIRVALPELKPEHPVDQASDDGPARKRARVGGSSGGAFSGFNAFLPAPKRAAEKTAPVASTRKVFSLKTGAERGFDRDADAEMKYITEVETSANAEEAATSGSQGMSESKANSTPATTTPIGEVKLQGNPMMFRPLSVGRPQKKKKKAAATNVESSSSTLASASTAASSESTKQPTPVENAAPPPPKPKVSLFSLSSETTSSTEPSGATAGGSYEPLVYDNEAEAPSAGPTLETDAQPTMPNYTQANPVSSSLNNIANDLNLSKAERRQLFGRNAPSADSRILTFNTDQEYAHNQALAESELAATQHNPVRAIAPGKHSLQQLVNAAASQKDALEESFAAGRRNKKEAGSRYGW